MSGIVGHSLYAVLGAKAAAHRGVGLAAIATRNFPSYLAGAYLGSDIQVMPEAWCVDTGREVGFGTVPLEKSPLTGGATVVARARRARLPAEGNSRAILRPSARRLRVAARRPSQCRGVGAVAGVFRRDA